MIDTRLDYDRDRIVLESPESFKKKKGIYPAANPADAINQDIVFKNELYSRIAERMPAYALNILSPDNEDNGFVKALGEAITQHIIDPAFISILLQSLEQRHDPDAPKARGVVGALLIDLVTDYIAKGSSEKAKTSDDSDKKKKKEEDTIDEKLHADTAEARRAAHILLDDLSREVKDVCAELEDHEALLIAGCIAVGGPIALKRIIAMDYPVTADVFNIVMYDNEVYQSLIIAALRLEADKYTKISANQKAFIESLKRWVFTNLNNLTNPHLIYDKLVAAYGSQKPENTKKYLIQVMDCGTSYGYLLSVARQLIVK